MPYTENNWLRRFNPTAEFTPTFVTVRDESEVVTALKAAFAFFRRSSDRRYSAQSLMRLLSYAEQMETAISNGTMRNGDFPTVITCSVPYEYDEETEVKRGGIVAMAVLLPDNRLMLAVHQDKRRQKVGQAVLRLIRQVSPTTPVVWVHQENIAGQQFCLSNGLLPRQVNPQGAVAYAENHVVEEDSLAVMETQEWELEEAVERNRPRRARPQRSRPVFTDEYADDEPAPSISRSWEECDRPDCEQCAEARRDSVEAAEDWLALRPMPAPRDELARSVF